MTHGIHMADTDECGGHTALIEMFPQMNTEKGVKNMNIQVSLLAHCASQLTQLGSFIPALSHCMYCLYELLFSPFATTHLHLTHSLRPQVGRQYYTWQNSDPAKEINTGTMVDIPQITSVLREAVDYVLAGRRC